MASKAASDVLKFGPRFFVQRPTSLPSFHAIHTAIPVGLPSLSFGLVTSINVRCRRAISEDVIRREE